MYILSYEDLVRHVQDGMERKGLQVRKDEVVYLNDMARACELLIQLPEKDGHEEGPWGKLIIEWVPENEVFVSQLEEHDLNDPFMQPNGLFDERGAQVMLHAAFHMHFESFSIGIDRVHQITEVLRTQAEEYFGGDGDVVAEVRLTASEAALACLRYEVNAGAMVYTPEPWWEEWVDIFVGMLNGLRQLYDQLASERQEPDE